MHGEAFQLRETPKRQADRFTFFVGFTRVAVYGFRNAKGHYIWSDGSEYFGEFHEAAYQSVLSLRDSNRRVARVAVM